MNKKTPLKTMVLLVIISVISILYVRIKVEHVKIGYEISRNNKLEKSLIQERQDLRAEFMKLKSPERLTLIADKLGFKYPTQNDIFYIEKATIVGKKK
jgi:cell division protein FtsL